MKHHKLFMLSLFLPALLAVSCAKDRNADDYQTQKAQQEMIKDQSVAADYIGTVTDSQGNPQEAIDFQFSVSSNNVISSDGVSIAQPYLTGSVLLLNTPNSYAKISSATYTLDDNSNSGTLKAKVQLQDDNGVTQLLDITGTIAGDNFSGTIVPQAYTKNRLSFNTSRAVGAGSSSVQNSAEISRRATSELDYEGKLDDPACEVIAAGMDGKGGAPRPGPDACIFRAVMTIERSGPHSDQNFFNFFSVAKLYDVDVNFFKKTIINGGILVPRTFGESFAATTLDTSGPHPRLLQRSTGAGSSSSNGSNNGGAVTRLKCDPKQFDTGTGWDCDIVVAGILEHIGFQPKVSTSLKTN